MTFHTIIVVGNLGKDPELRYLPSGQAVANFNVAASNQYTDSSGQLVKQTLWFRVTTWGKLAETCNQYLTKGKKVLVEGRLNADPSTGGPRLWKRQDETMSASYEITAQTVRFLSARGESEGSYPSEEHAGQVADDGDIPF